MGIIMKFLIILLIALIKCKEEDYKKEKNIIVLTDDDFEKAVKEFDYLVVFFSAPWSGPCKRFLPDFEEGSKDLKKFNITSAKIDCQTQKKIKKQYNITDYPTLYLFINDTLIKYTDNRLSKGKYIEWCKKKVTNPPAIEYTKEEDISKMTKENNIFVVYFGENDEEIKIFNKVAIKISSYKLGICKSKEIAENFKAKMGTVVLFKKFDEKRNEISSFDEKNLETFLEEYTIPKITPFNDKVYKKIFNSKKPILLLYADKNKTDEYKSYKKMLSNVAEKYKREMTFIITDIKDNNGGKLASQIDVRKKEIPTVRIMVTAYQEMKKYRFNKKEITEENLLKFIKDWKNNKIKPMLKSEKVPTSNDGDVFVLVGSNYEDEVINNDKDVMVLFYAPWCGHCKSLHPKYEKMAKRLKSKNKKLLIAKIDYTENEVENMVIEGFPTIKFYPGNNKKAQPIEYSGDRSVEDMINFIKKNSYHTVNDDGSGEDL